MSSGGMFYVADLGALAASFAGRAAISPADLIGYLETHAHFLANGAHMPASFDAMLARDRTLEQSGYPPAFRYARLFYAPAVLGVTPEGDAPLVGAIPAEIVAEAAARARAEGAPRASDAWEERALAELLANAAAAAELGYGLVGVYT